MVTLRNELGIKVELAYFRIVNEKHLKSSKLEIDLDELLEDIPNLFVGNHTLPENIRNSKQR